MAKFLLLSSLGPEGFARLDETPERIHEVNADVESMGVKILHQYAVLGPYDFVTIIEAPDEATMMRVTTKLAARGTMKTTTLSILDVDGYIEALR